MLTEQATHGIEWLREELDRLVASFQTSLGERRVGYGNLRHEYSTWNKEDDEITNIAIIYETPGGSTTQLNISHSGEEGTLAYLDSELGSQVITKDGREALKTVRDHVRLIPVKRQDQLDRQVDVWMGEGKSKREVFAELNKLLQAEFLGGQITTYELKQSIQHAIERRTQVDAEADD